MINKSVRLTRVTLLVYDKALVSIIQTPYVYDTVLILPLSKMKLSVFTNFSEVTQNWNADFLTPMSRAHSTLFLDLTHTYFICASLNALLNLLGVLPNLKDILSFLRGSQRSRGRREYGSPLSLLHLVPLGGTCQVATAYSWVSVFPTWSEINPVLDTVRDIVMNVLAQHLPYKYASSDWAALTLTRLEADEG